MTPPPLRHADPSRSDDRLAADASGHLSRHPSLQLIAELYTRLREMTFPWWTPEQLREAFPSSQRLGWLSERADLRQRITTQLTGLAPRAARNKTSDFQASLIDSVIDEGDITVEAFETAFEPADLAVYAPSSEIWKLFRRRMPWDDDSTPHQDLVGWLIGALLADKSALDGSMRTPVLSAVQVRMAIDGRVWHSRIPLHVRVAIDDARFAAQRERPTEPYGVERDLAIATPALIAASIPLRDLLGVVDVATQALGFEENGGLSRAYAREATSRSSAPRAPDSDESPPETNESPLTTSQRPPPIVSERPPSMSERPPRMSERPPRMSERPPRMSERPPRVSERPPPPTQEQPEIELHSVHETEPPNPADLVQFNDEPTSDSRDKMRESATDELEHTNPWVVPQLSGELAQIAKEIAKEIREAREKKKTEEEG